MGGRPSTGVGRDGVEVDEADEGVAERGGGWRRTGSAPVLKSGTRAPSGRDPLRSGALLCIDEALAPTASLAARWRSLARSTMTPTGRISCAT